MMGKGKLKPGRKQPSKDINIEENSIEIMYSSFFSRIPEEILLEILSWLLSSLPIKEIFNIRRVSKGINKLTRTPAFAAKHSRNCKPLTGFFYQCRERLNSINGKYLYDTKFIPLLEPEPSDLVPDPSLMFLKQKGKNSNEVVELIDSCNGLLLCCTYNGKKCVQTYLVCNPFTKERASLPHPPRTTSMLNGRFSFALLADTTSYGYLRYKVFCVFLNPNRKCPDHQQYSTLLILSSETGKWEEIDERLPPLCDENSMIYSKVVLNGRLFWNCLEDYILVCQNKKRCYELIEAPCSLSLGRSLWKSKDDKLLCYYHRFVDDTVCVWSKELELEGWKVEENKEEFERLTEDVLCQLTAIKSCRWKSIRGLSIKSRAAFKIIGYNPGSNMIYLWKDMLLRYDVKERKFENVWGVECGLATSCLLPYTHSFAPIQININNAKIKDEEKEMVEGSMNALSVKDDSEE